MAGRGPVVPERGQRVRIALQCSVCGARNYKTTRARRPGTAPIQLAKFCRTCNAHTQHLEAR